MTKNNMPADDTAAATEIDDRDLPLIESPVGREDDQGGDPGTLAFDEVFHEPAAVPRSTITGKHDAGSGANETIDGLNSTEEMTRRSAEDVPTGRRTDVRDLPVFDRGDTLPRV